MARVLVNALAAKAGGLRNFMVNLIQRLDAEEDGNDYIFLLPDATAASVTRRGAHLRVVPFRLLPRAPLARAAWEQVVLPVYARSLRADVLVSASSFGPRVPLCRHLVWLRNDLYFSPEYARLIASDPAESRRIARSQALLRSSLAGADRVAVLQDGMIERVRSVAPLPRERFVVIPNACPAPEGSVRPEVAQLRARHPGRYIIDLVQHHHRYRNFETALRALRRLVDRGRTDVLLILSVDPADEPPHSARLLADVEAQGLSPYVHNFGRVNLAEVYSLYEQADVAIFPSMSEAFSVTYLMAMQAGAPVLASDMPFARALCGDAALYFPYDDPDALASCLEDVRDPSVAASLAKAAEPIRGAYTWSRTVSAFRDALRETQEASG